MTDANHSEPGRDPSTAAEVEVRELDVRTEDGRTLHAYDTGAVDGPEGPHDAEPLVVVWFHGTPNIGPPPRPLFEAARRLGVRWVGYDRPGYGGSTPRPDRDVASAAGDVTRVLDALGIGSFAVMGHSGGGPHALACAALVPDRVSAVVVGASLAPYGPSTADGLDWFAGMASSGAASLRAAVAGRAAKERHEATAGEPDDLGFVANDEAMFAGPWGWFGSVVGPALAAGPAPVVDDDLAYVRDWGFDPADVTAPTLVLHGGADRVVPGSHGEWLARRVPGAQLWLEPGEGHISVLRRGEDALAWLADAARRPRP